MKRISFRTLSLIAMGTALALVNAPRAVAGIIYVGVTNGDVYQYDSVAQMAMQTSTTITGTKVRDNATSSGNYANDQGATADLSTGIVYRVANNGNVFSYPSVADYLTGSNSTNLTSGLNPYSTGNTKRINGVSYDPATGGFYAVGAGSDSLWPGDIVRFNSLATFLTGVPDAVTTNAYNGNVVNFYDPDPTPGMTVGNMANPSHAIDAHYFQIAGNGRLEGFASIAEYAVTANNRIDVSQMDVFGGAHTLGFQAGTAFAVPIPEPQSVFLCLGAACSMAALRRR
jgi:hypothetical protein